MSRFLQVHFSLLILVFIHHYFAKSFDCVETDDCFGQIMTCSDEDHCSVHCAGESTCSFSTVICPQSSLSKCSVICNGTFSCSDMMIAAQNTMFLDIITNGYNTLSFSKIYCPSNTINNSCNITYIGTQYGLNNIDIYTTHTFNSINLKCNSINNCWSNHNNPILNYGNTYSKTCTIYDMNTCTESVVLFESHNTSFISTIKDDVNSVLTKNDNAIHTQSIYYALMLVSIGIVCGVLISICFCICLYVYFTQKHKVEALRIDKTQIKNSSMKAIKVSKSLQQLSPRLQSIPATPSVIELPRHNKHQIVNSMQVEVDTTMRLSEYIDYVDFVNEGLPNSYKETPIGSTTFIIPGSSEDETPMGNTLGILPR